MPSTDQQKISCKRCEFEMVEVKKDTIKEIIKVLNPDFKSLPKNWKSMRTEWVKVCPSCDAYLLGIEMEKGFPFRTISSEIGTIQNLDFIKAHKHHNYRQEILDSPICGCFYCLETFSPNEIFQWHGEDENGVEQIAICPKCSIDSVIGSASGYPIKHAFLMKMRDFWFSPMSG